MALSDLLGLAGLMMTVLATLAGVFRFLWSELKDVESRVRLLEADRHDLHSLKAQFHQKFNEASERITEP